MEMPGAKRVDCRAIMEESQQNSQLKTVQEGGYGRAGQHPIGSILLI